MRLSNVTATNGENEPVREMPMSVGAVACMNIVTNSQRNIPVINATRTIGARRRSGDHAPTV